MSEPDGEEDRKWFTVCLRIMGDALDPAQVEPLLGLKPDCTGLKGVPRTGRQGRTYAPYETNLWVFREEAGPGDGFDQLIRKLFARLGPNLPALQAWSATPGIEVELFCGYGSASGQGGDTLQPGTIKMLADAGVALTLNLYPPGLEDDLDGVGSG